MAKRSIFKPADMQKMLDKGGIAASTRAGTASTDPTVRSAKAASAEFIASHPEAMRLYHAERTLPSGATYIIAENRTPDEWVNYYEKVMGNKTINPYDKAGDWQTVEEGGEPIRTDEFGTPLRASEKYDPSDVRDRARPIGRRLRRRRPWTMRDIDLWFEANPNLGDKDYVPDLSLTPERAMGRAIANKIVKEREAKGAGKVAERRVKPADFVEGVDEEREMLKEFTDAGLLPALTEKDFNDIAAMKGTPYMQSVIWKLFGGHDKYDEAVEALAKSKRAPTVEEQTGLDRRTLMARMLERTGHVPGQAKIRALEKALEEEKAHYTGADRVAAIEKELADAKAKSEADMEALLNRSEEDEFVDWLTTEAALGTKGNLKAQPKTHAELLQQEADKKTQQRMDKIRLTPTSDKTGYTSFMPFKNKNGETVHVKIDIPDAVDEKGVPYKSAQEVERDKAGFAQTAGGRGKAQKHMENRDDAATKEILATGRMAGLANKGLGGEAKRTSGVPQAVIDKYGQFMTAEKLKEAWTNGIFEKEFPKADYQHVEKTDPELEAWDKKRAEETGQTIKTDAERHAESIANLKAHVAKRRAMASATPESKPTAMAKSDRSALVLEMKNAMDKGDFDTVSRISELLKANKPVGSKGE